MTLGGVKAGDIVLWPTARAARFYAIVVERHERELEVDPIDRRVTYRASRPARCSGSGARAAPERARAAKRQRPRHDALTTGADDGRAVLVVPRRGRRSTRPSPATRRQLPQPAAAAR